MATFPYLHSLGEPKQCTPKLGAKSALPAFPKWIRLRHRESGRAAERQEPIGQVATPSSQSLAAAIAQSLHSPARTIGAGAASALKRSFSNRVATTSTTKPAVPSP